MFYDYDVRGTRGSVTTTTHVMDTKDRTIDNAVML